MSQINREFEFISTRKSDAKVRPLTSKETIVARNKEEAVKRLKAAGVSHSELKEVKLAKGMDLFKPSSIHASPYRAVEYVWRGHKVRGR